MKKIMSALFLIFCILSSGKAQKNSINAAQTVDHFSGAFTYSVPLISVPSPNGPSVRLSTSYRSGIRMNQKSSIIGLGWNLSFGEITRQVNGFPDDYNGQVVNIKEFQIPFTNPTGINEKYYGPLYYHEFNLNDASAKMDVSAELIQGNAAYFPNYDNFYVNASGISGEIMAPLLEYASLVNEDVVVTEDDDGNTVNDVLIDYLNTNDSEGGCEDFTLKPIFNYLNSKSYSYNTSTSSVSETDDLGNDKSWVKPPSSSNNIKSQNGSKFIRYFTNDEIINDFDPSVSSNIMKMKGFLDFQIGNRNPADYPLDGIGAFQITNEHNFTYHFSLPVYVNKDISVNLKLNELGEIDDSVNDNRLVELSTPYAVSWKLTAITGPNYKDENENGIADEGDYGYWIVYDYGTTISDYKYNIPDFGLNLSSNHNIDIDQITDRENHSFVKKGSSKRIEIDEVFLTKISSASHYAKLYYEDALDTYGVNNSGSPLIKLTNIALFSKEDLESTIPTNTWQSSALQYVHFDQDYSLCKEFIHNLHTSTGMNDVNSFQADFDHADFDLREVTSSSPYNYSGKLTLKGVEFYGRNNTETSPPYSFDYETNPNYDADKYDYFGFYKSDKTGTNERYVTSTSAQMTNAWSLSKIGTPLGAEIVINYEPNEYISVLNSEYAKPTRFFVSNADYLNSNGGLDNVLDSDYSYFKTHSDFKNEVLWGNQYTVNTNPATSYIGNPTTQITFSQIFLDKDYGGGSRVKNVIVKNSAEEFKTEFEYYDGVLTKAVGEFYGNAGSGNIQNIGRFTKIDNESAKVGYGLVKSYNVGSNGNSDGKTLYKFSTLYKLFRERSSSIKMKTIKIDPHNDGQDVDSEPYPEKISNFFTKVKINEFGNLLQHQVFDNNDNIVEESIYSYIRANTVSSKVHYASKNWWEKSNTMITFDLPPMYRCDVNGEIMFFSPERKNLDALNEHYGNIISTTPTSGYSAPNFDEHLQPYSQPVKDSIEAYHNQTNFGYVYEDLEDPCILFDPNVEVNYYYPYEVIIDIQNVVRVNKTFSSLRSVKHYKNGIWETKTIDNYSGVSTRPFITEIIDETGADLRVETYRFNESKFDNEFGDNLIDQDQLTETYVHNELVSKVRNVRDFNALIRTHNPMPSSNQPSIEFSDFVYKQQVWDLEQEVWITTQESKLFNEDLNVLEQESYVDNFSAVKYGYEGMYPIASIANSRYTEFTFSGFEDEPNANAYYESEVHSSNTRIQGVGAMIAPHTGGYMLEMTPNSSIKYTMENSTVKKKGYYRISIWCHKETLTDNSYVEFDPKVIFNGGAIQSLPVDNRVITEMGDWLQFKADVYIDPSLPIDADFVISVLNSASNSANLYFDDFRFQPVDSEMSSTVYDKKTGQVLYVLDSENYYSRYEYDDAGSVIKIYKETPNGEVLIQENSTHFKNF